MNTMDSHPINKSHNIIGFKYRGPTKSYPRVANQLNVTKWSTSKSEIKFPSVICISKNEYAFP